MVRICTSLYLNILIYHIVSICFFSSYSVLITLDLWVFWQFLNQTRRYKACLLVFLCWVTLAHPLCCLNLTSRWCPPHLTAPPKSLCSHQNCTHWTWTCEVSLSYHSTSGGWFGRSELLSLSEFTHWVVSRLGTVTLTALWSQRPHLYTVRHHAAENLRCGH